jgi:4-alpha-glucanotransferase
MRFAHSGRFLSGVVAPLSSLKTASSPGCGEFPDLEAFADLALSWNLDLVQLLPVNDTGTQGSPYSALSAFALHPIHLRLSNLPELGEDGPAALGGKAAAAALRKEAAGLVERFGASVRVPREELLAAKLSILEKIWTEKTARTVRKGEGASRKAELESWIDGNPWIRDYAAFVELKARSGGKPWWEWREFRDPLRTEIEALWADPAFADRLRFQAWVQMRSQGQFREAAERCAARGVVLMGDIPILMNEDSAEVWARRDCFRLELKAGAPPDMFARLGQNWGFPIYDWEAMAKDDYRFWVERLVEADKFYSAYRIDHVLGFFRIWALGERESSGYLGRFVPGAMVRRDELEAAGFSADRMRWLSRPHIPARRLVEAAGEAAARGAMNAALDRIGNEELFLFKDGIRGERDIEALPGLSPAARDFLLEAWRDRVLFEASPGNYAPAWRFRDASAWPTLSDGERWTIEDLVRRKNSEAETLWEETGRRLLSRLETAVPMLPCAEDLGAVPDCVPEVLGELGILGLRVLRWARRWNEAGQPYISPAEYPRLSVACASVHDSSSLRGWWEEEADRHATWSLAADCLRRDIGPCPEKLGPREAETLHELVASSNSLFAVYPIQDLIALSEAHRPTDPRDERINVPGVVSEGNWTYRMFASIEELAGDRSLAARIRRIAKARPASARGEKRTC